jgi:hypothetical protein
MKAKWDISYYIFFLKFIHYLYFIYFEAYYTWTLDLLIFHIMDKPEWVNNVNEKKCNLFCCFQVKSLK